MVNKYTGVNLINCYVLNQYVIQMLLNDTVNVQKAYDKNVLKQCCNYIQIGRFVYLPVMLEKNLNC